LLITGKATSYFRILAPRERDRSRAVWVGDPVSPSPPSINVRYVLEGSVQRGESRMRINVQLIEAESGRHL
jgi:hypothetical protein